MSTVAVVKRIIGWRPNQPEHQPHCRQCRHAGLSARTSQNYIDCAQHGFFTFSHATCSSHTPATPATQSTEESAA